jgi:hypothetical protein
MGNTTTGSVADPDPESGIGYFLTPGSGMEKSGPRIRDEHPRSFFRELRNSFFDKKKKPYHT